MLRETKSVPRIDALLPAEMAVRAESVGVRKAGMGFYTKFALSILAGTFIGLGGIFYTIVTAPTLKDGVVVDALPFGVSRLVGGVAFCLGLILVIVGGAELFTGNNLIVMAWANRKVSTARLLRNWLIVYLGNFVGSVILAALVCLSNHYLFGNGAVGLNALNIANGKVHLGIVPALGLGILCNTLVCMAVWLTFSARSTADKIVAIIYPVSAFVAAGFEHSVANMYFVPLGLLIKQFAPATFWESIGKTSADYANLTWGSFLVNNLLPVTIGNIIGGAVLVGAIYWFVYLRPKNSPVSPQIIRDYDHDMD